MANSAPTPEYILSSFRGPTKTVSALASVVRETSQRLLVGYPLYTGIRGIDDLQTARK
jgi:hypothetical protein